MPGTQDRGAGPSAPPECRDVWATPTRQRRGSEAAAGLPRLRGRVGEEPLGVSRESLSACTPLCQGMAAGMEKRGPVIVDGLPSANYPQGAVCTAVAHCSGAPPLPSCRAPTPSAGVSTELRLWGLSQVELELMPYPLSSGKGQASPWVVRDLQRGLLGGCSNFHRTVPG